MYYFYYIFHDTRSQAWPVVAQTADRRSLIVSTVRKGTIARSCPST